MKNVVVEILKKFHEEPAPEKEQVFGTIVCKAEEEESRLFYSVVLEPWTEVTAEGDTHGHRIKKEEVEKSAHYYMEMGSTVFKNHKSKIEASVVESYLAPVDFTPEGSDVEITKGSWVMVVKVHDDEMWEDIKSGEITAFSPGGYGDLTDLE